MKSTMTFFASAALAVVLAQTPAFAQEYFARQQLVVPSSGPGTGNPGTGNPTDPNGPGDPSNGPGNWQVGDWSEWNSTCSATAMRLRPVVCLANGETVADERCAMAKPEATEVSLIYSGCETIIQEGTFFPGGLRYWNVSSGGQLYRVGDSANGVVVIPGGSLAQTTLVPLETGKAYVLKATQMNSGGTAFRVQSRVTISSNGQTLASQDYRTTSTSVSVPFVGTGAPVTVTFVNTLTTTNGIMFSAISIN